MSSHDHYLEDPHVVVVLDGGPEMLFIFGSKAEAERERPSILQRYADTSAEVGPVEPDRDGRIRTAWRSHFDRSEAE